MTLALLCAALRRRPFTLACTALLVLAASSLVGAPVVLAFVIWLAGGFTALELWHVLESVALRRRGFRPATCGESERFGASLGCGHLQVLVLDEPQLWWGRGLRHLVVTRAVLDVLEDRALSGILFQTAAHGYSAAVAGQIVAWVGALPITSAWYAGRGLLLLGRWLASIVGHALVLPMVFWPIGFVRWAGFIFGAGLVAIVGSTLVSSGLAASGAALLLAWAIVPALRALLAWETRRAERSSDHATIAAGLGCELLEALETLSVAEPLPPPPAGLLGVLCPIGERLTQRADRIRAALPSA